MGYLRMRQAVGEEHPFHCDHKLLREAPVAPKLTWVPCHLMQGQVSGRGLQRVGHLSSPADVTACVIHVGISQNTERCSSSSVSQPQILVISPGWPDLQGFYPWSQSLRQSGAAAPPSRSRISW